MRNDRIPRDEQIKAKNSVCALTLTTSLKTAEISIEAASD